MNSTASEAPDLILRNAKITTLDPARPEACGLAVRGGRVTALEGPGRIEGGPHTVVIDAHGRRVIPGLNDSHMHPIRAGLHYNLELRWDGVPSLADALRRLRGQAQRTPPPQWVRVVGGWNEFQFAERRLPTLQELNDAAPETPVFVLYLYAFAMLNGAALRALGYSQETPDPPGGEIQRDRSGNPTGLLIARPSALILYGALARGPRLAYEDQRNSTQHFLRELSRLGLTSVIDAGGGFQGYPEDYAVIEDLHRTQQLSVRLAYNLFTQHAGGELADFQRWTAALTPGQGDAMYRLNGAGEMLVFSAADFEDFLEPRPELAASLEGELEAVVRHLVERRWPFRIHATYDESIARFLGVFERVARDIPFGGLRWWFDHAETISPQNLERTRALGGGIAVQNRMAFQGEHFVARHGAQAAEHAPPIRRMLELGIPVGAGTDGTRVSSYNPWVSLYWLVTGKTVGGLALFCEPNCMSREEALRLYTAGSAWFSGEQGEKGALAVGQHADFAVLSADYFSVPELQIRDLESVLTVVGGRVMHASAEFSPLAPPLPPVSPSWSPVGFYGAHCGAAAGHSAAPHAPPVARLRSPQTHPHTALTPQHSGCDCFVF